MSAIAYLTLKNENVDMGIMVNICVHFGSIVN